MDQLCDYLERAACFLIIGFIPHAFHPYEDLLKDGFLCTKGCTGTPPKGFFSGNGLTGTFFCDSEDSAMIVCLLIKRLEEIYKVMSAKQHFLWYFHMLFSLLRNQRFFFFFSYSFDFILQCWSHISIFYLFTPKQNHRTSSFGIFCSDLRRIMIRNSFFQIFCNTGIQGSIMTSDYIYRSHTFYYKSKTNANWFHLSSPTL